MGKTKRRGKSSSTKLTADEWMILECGFPFDRDAALTEPEVRELWERHRFGYKSSTPYPGSRPWAWWIYDSGIGKLPDGGRELVTLIELGEITAEDVVEMRKMPGTSYWPEAAAKAWEAREADNG